LWEQKQQNFGTWQPRNLPNTVKKSYGKEVQGEQKKLWSIMGQHNPFAEATKNACARGGEIKVLFRSLDQWRAGTYREKRIEQDPKKEGNHAQPQSASL